MTVIAGVLCAGSAVLGADTEETSTDIKFSAEKLVGYDRDWGQVAFAGAGNYGDLVQTVINNAQADLDVERPETFDRTLSVIRASLVRSNRNEVRSYQAKTENKAVEVLIALRPKLETSVQLWSGSCAAINQIYDYDVRGTGEVMRFIAKRLFRDRLSLSQGVLLATYLVNLSKKNVPNVGGESRILILRPDGWLSEGNEKEIELSETYLDHFDTVLGNLFLAYADTGLSEQQFNDKLTEFVNLTKALRIDLSDQFAQMILERGLTDPDTKDPYQKLSHGQHKRFGKTKVTYKWAEEGKSGYTSQSVSASPSASLSRSVSASSSPSPSPSASPSPEDESDDIVGDAVNIVEESLEEKGDKS